MASLTIKINAKYYLQAAQVYAPTSTHEDEEVEEYYEEGSKNVTVNKRYYKIETLMQKSVVNNREMEQRLDSMDI